MAHSGLTAIGLLSLSVLIAGCDEMALQGNSGGTQSNVVQPGQVVLRVEQRDVDKPDVFSFEGRGIWDGRPSIGGLWVQIKTDVDYSRVRITNLDNGREIVGAAFKRDDSFPGPAILVSSEAADPLGMLPGSPAELRVVAIVREEVEIMGDAPSAPADPVAAPIPVPVQDADQPAADAAAQSAEASDDTFVAPPDDTQPATQQAQAPAPLQEITLQSTVLAAIESAPDPTPSALSRPFIQVASGGNKDGADAALRKIEGAGLSGDVRSRGTDDKPFYVVVAGPFADTAGRASALETLKGLGYKDAFPVR